MGPHLTFKQYRGIDLAIFAAILALTEFLIVRAAKSWFPDQLYTVSVTAAVTAIVLMRWGPFAGIHAALGGLVYAWTSGGNLQQFVIYVVGNVLSMAAILLFKAFGKEKIRKSFLLTLLFALSVIVLMQVGRGLVALIFGNGIGVIWKFITMDALSDLFTLVVVWVASRLDGVFEDQKHYLLRQQKEREEQQNDQSREDL
ncbi:MAG: hypothetical protein IK150_03715 [Lachnospiraceae bacterium]|jgi:hypothetical protein|nr:hypothetical protein [Lachnospiraceae bacterium]